MTSSQEKKDEYYKEHTNEQYYEQATDLSSYHDHIKEEEQLHKEVQEETGVELVGEIAHTYRNGQKSVYKVPNRIAFQDQKVAMGRLPIWFLNALGSMSEQELDDFVDEYRDELSINERAALDLIQGVRDKNKKALEVFWNIQLKLLNKTNVVNQVNVSIQKPDAVVSNLLDEIASKIKNA